MRDYQKENAGKRKAGCILLTVGFALLFISRISHSFAQWYSGKIYPVWVGSIGKLSGIFPFSLSELFLYLLLLWLAVTGSIRINSMIRRKEDKAVFYGWLWSLFLLAAVLFCLYAINCGVNYNKISFSESSGITVREYSKEELRRVCLRLTDEVNVLSKEVKRDENGIMQMDAEAGKRAVAAMKELGNTYSELSGYYPKPKGLLVPWILSVQKLSGVYSPFTVEANYNSGMTDYNIPFTMCHELSHLRGFMQEQEANFIAFLSCSSSGERDFCYSGKLMGWIYCMNVLRKEDYDAWEKVRESLLPEVQADLDANHKFWAEYDGRIAEVSNQVNNTYLKANGQADGVKSYDKMVDLIVVYYIGRVNINETKGS